VKTISRTLISLKNSIIRFCKNNPNIIFIIADKGNVTMAMNRDKYISKIEIMLLDKNTYITVKKKSHKEHRKKLK